MQTPLRLRPGVVLLTIQLLLLGAGPLLPPEFKMYTMLGGMACALGVVIWWVFFSRAPWLERLGAIAISAALMIASRLFLHPSINNGMMGMMFFIYGIPVVTMALVAWAVVTRNWTSTPVRLASMTGAILLACAAFAPLRTDGITGSGSSQFAWRWTKTAEQKLLEKAPLPVPPPQPVSAELASTPAIPVAAPASETRLATPPAPIVPAIWPGFRGPARSGVVGPGAIQINTDWTNAPPTELWRKPVGPGWSSFAVQEDRIYTQEQRGEEEIVSCYNAATGAPVWAHTDAVRFWESNAGAGPRATPAVYGGNVYALGATGILNALDARTGKLVWRRNAASDAGVKVPGWGISGSPLVIGDLVIVAASGRLAAYSRTTGEPRWFGPKGRGGSYSSPHRASIGGVDQVLLLSDAGSTSVSPENGTLLWKYDWPGFKSVQPAIIGEGDVLVTTSDSSGGLATRRLAVSQGPSGWTVEERWTSKGLKPYFNDFVVHQGHAYGFDGHILSCIDLKDGTRKWKGGRFGAGQMILLPGQDVLLVLSEEGDLALVSATSAEYREIAKVKAIEGKTWNHPAVAGDTVLVRNGEEMAAFRLPLVTATSSR